MAIPVPTRQDPGLEVPVFLDIESRVHRTINRALRRALAEQTKGMVAAARAGDVRGVQDRINAINFGPAAEEIRGELEVLALNGVILGAAQFVEGKKARNTKFVRDREIPIEVMQAVNQIVRGLDGSQTENVRRDAQVVAGVLEAKLSEGSPDDTRLLKQLGAASLGGFGVGQLATALNVAVNTGSTVQAGIAANIMTTRMVSFGALAQAGVQGIGRYQWNAVLDSNTCPFCRGMNGKTFQVGPALSQIRAIILAGDPETAKALSPWPSQTAANIGRLAKLSNSKLQAGGLAVPPAHPSCRCVLSRVGTVPQSQIKGFIAQALRARQVRKPIADKLLQGVKAPKVVRPSVTRPPARPIPPPPEAPLVSFEAAESTQQMWATGPKGSPTYTPARVRTIHNPVRQTHFKGKRTFAQTGEEKTTHILGGGSGSGKGTVQKAGLIEGITKDTIAVDSDAIKKAFPEYRRMVKVRDPEAAVFSHNESSFLARQIGSEGMDGNFHMLLDGTGDGPISKLTDTIKLARKAGNRVVGDFVNIPTDEAVLRALVRASGPEGRMVPEAMIRSIHRNVSINLDHVVNRRLFNRVKLWDNTGPKPILVMEQRGRKLIIRNKKLWKEFLEKSKENSTRRILTKAQIKQAVDGGPEVAKRIVAEVRLKFNIPEPSTIVPKPKLPRRRKPVPKQKPFPKINPADEFDAGIEELIEGSLRRNAAGEVIGSTPPKLRGVRGRTDLTVEERGAAGRYGGQTGPDLNEKLRKGKRLNDVEQNMVDQLDSAIEKSALPEDVVLYRGVKDMVSEGGLNFRPGLVFRDDGFNSWSFSRDTVTTFSFDGKLVGQALDRGGGTGKLGVIADRAVYRIRLKKGQKGLFMDPDYEKEVLLKRGLKYRVVKVEEEVLLSGNAGRIKELATLNARLEAAEGKSLTGIDQVRVTFDQARKREITRVLIDLEVVL